MIVVTFTMDVHGKGESRHPLGVICIANDGKGTAEYGDYDYAISHTGNYIKRKDVYKKGKVRNFKRSLGVYKLLGRVLKDAGMVK